MSIASTAPSVATIEIAIAAAANRSFFRNGIDNTLLSVKPMSPVDPQPDSVRRRTVVVFAAVAIGLVGLGIALLAGIRAAPERAPMAVYYLSMTCRCPWHNLPKALEYVE